MVVWLCAAIRYCRPSIDSRRSAFICFELQVLDPVIRQQRFEKSLQCIGLEACPETQRVVISGGQLRELGRESN